jgi:hypothetical protein
MVLTVSFALSPVTGLVCHRRPQETRNKPASQELDASVGASGPHDFAVRRKARSSVALPASTASHPNVRDDRDTPLVRDETAMNMQVIWANMESKYFCERGWTGKPLICPSGARCYRFNMASRCLTSLSSCSCCWAIRSDVRSSSCAPEDPAACSTNCRILSRSIAMRSLSSDKEGEFSLLIFVPEVLWRKARPDDRLRRNPLLFFGGRRITLIRSI